MALRAFRVLNSCGYKICFYPLKVCRISKKETEAKEAASHLFDILTKFHFVFNICV